MTRRAWLLCGILSSGLYAAMTVIAPLAYPGYSSFSQTISELSAIGAPTRALWTWLGLGYAALLMAFGLGVRETAGGNGRLRLLGVLIMTGFALTTIGWLVAPMHRRDVLAVEGRTLTDTMHIAVAAVQVLLMIAVIGLGAAAFGWRFRWYSVATVLVLLVFGGLAGVSSHALEANLPTPWVGVWQRISVAAFLVWIVALALMLLRPAAVARLTLLLLALTAAVVGSGCAFVAPRVDLLGTTGDLARLNGEWWGEYAGARDHGRHGTIAFKLVAGDDHAHGDVVMIPGGDERPYERSRGGGPGVPAYELARRSRVLEIRFVMVSGEVVTGVIDEYWDPDRRTEAVATFRGRLLDGTIEGTFTTRYANGDPRTSGRWKVSRMPSR